MRVKLFNDGHSFDEIDALGLDDYFDILQVAQAEKKLSESKGKKR